MLLALIVILLGVGLRVRFLFYQNRTLSYCFVVFPDGKPVSTFPGNTLAKYVRETSIESESN